MNSFDLFGNPKGGTPAAERDPGERLNYTEEALAMGEEIDDGTAAPRRFQGLSVILALTVSVLAFQAYHLQISAGSENRAAAEGNSVRLLSLPADRGLIVDANGETLAQNSRHIALAINPQTLPSKRSVRDKVYALLKEKAGITDEDITSIEETRKATPEPFPIKTNLSKDESLLYREWFADTPGVVLQEIPVRAYADLPSLGQIMGYVGQADKAAIDAGALRNSLVGRAGIEKQYQTMLAGTAGVQRAEVNVAGEIVRLLPDGANSDPVTGNTLKLSIDSRIQRIVATALSNELARRTDKLGPLPKLGASAVVMDPRTGAIRAMVSLPDYASSLFAEGIRSDQYSTLLNDPATPLLNRAFQGSYAPGSTIKPVVASAGLQAGVIAGNTQMNTPEAITIGSFRFPDWKLHGQTNTRKAIAESNNIFFYAVGGGWEERGFQGLGITNLANYYRQFGLGEKTGIDLPGETAGLVPDPEWKLASIKEPWYIGDTYQASIGQGFVLASPLQMANTVSAIANGGTLWQPRVAGSVIDTKTGTETPLTGVVKRENLIDTGNLQIVREGMRQTVVSGSGRPLNGLKVTSAGKTGTAQFGNQGLLNAWYVGFAPYENPEYAFAIMIEGGGESFYSSVPVAEEILRGIFNEPLAPGQKLNAQTLVSNEFAGER